MILLFYYPAFGYLLCILISGAGKKSVISFLNRANPFHRVCLFCIFVTNRIYVIRKNWIQVVLLARYSKKGTGYNFCDNISISLELRYLQGISDL